MPICRFLWVPIVFCGVLWKAAVFCGYLHSERPSAIHPPISRDTFFGGVAEIVRRYRAMRGHQVCAPQMLSGKNLQKSARSAFGLGLSPFPRPSKHRYHWAEQPRLEVKGRLKGSACVPAWPSGFGPWLSAQHSQIAITAILPPKGHIAKEFSERVRFLPGIRRIKLPSLAMEIRTFKS